jgi:hypothetical protein
MTRAKKMKLEIAIAQRQWHNFPTCYFLLRSEMIRESWTDGEQGRDFGR